MADLKKGFSKALSITESKSVMCFAHGERGIRQRRFQEYVIRDDENYAAQIDYCIINPVHTT